MALASPASAATTAADVVRTSLTRRRADISGMVMLVLLLAAVAGSLGVLVLLLGQVITEGWPALSQRGTGLLTESIGSEPDKIGIWPGLYGSFFIGLGVILVALPLGIGAAVYLEEYARPNRVTRFIQVNIRNLAGVPAVVYGVLGLTLFTDWFDFITQGKTVIAAALTMAILVLPIVIITAMEAVRAVPQGLRDAGYGLGSSRWEVTRDHVLPYAAPGILTGVVLSMARALGEAAPLIILGAVTGLLNETSLTSSFTAIPMVIFDWSSNADTASSTLSFSEMAAAASVVLLVLVLFFNAAAILLRNRFERKRAGV
jgi:phosphate transport system permease protein